MGKQAGYSLLPLHSPFAWRVVPHRPRTLSSNLRRPTKIRDRRSGKDFGPASKGEKAKEDQQFESPCILSDESQTREKLRRGRPCSPESVETVAERGRHAPKRQVR